MWASACVSLHFVSLLRMMSQKVFVLIVELGETGSGL